MTHPGGMTATFEILCIDCAEIRGINVDDPVEFYPIEVNAPVTYCNRCGVVVDPDAMPSANSVVYVEVCERCGGETRKEGGS